MSAETAEVSKAAPRKKRRGEVVMLAVTATAILGTFGLFFALNASSNVWFVNGLDVPVNVLIDGSKMQVGAGAKVDVRLRAGTRDVRVQGLSGALLEEGPFDVPGGYDVVVYNVLGAAPLYSAEVQYGTSYGTPPEPLFHGNQRSYIRENVNYVFSEPPTSISIKSGESRTRTRFDLIPGGWVTTASYLDQRAHQTGAAAELCRAVARAEPDDPRALAYARHFTQLASGTDGQLSYLRGEMARRPEDVDMQLSYASTMRRAGRGAEVRAAYRPRFAANPQSIALGSVLIRVETFDEVRTITQALLTIDPKSVLARENAAQLAFETEDFARCAEIYASLAGTPNARERLDDHARALVAQKKTPEALALVGSALAADAEPDLNTSLLYARIAALPGAGAPLVPPTLYLDQNTKKGGTEAQLWVKLQLGAAVRDGEMVDVKDDQLRRGLEIQREAEKDPKDAWTRCAAADNVVLGRLPSTVALLLAAEFARAGDVELANRILAEHSEYSVPYPALLDYALTGTESPDLWRLDPEWRAALDLVRARRQEELELPAKALYEAAERRDHFQTIVTRARKAWPSTGKPAEIVSGKAKAGLTVKGQLKGGVVGGVVGGLGISSSSEAPKSPQVVFKKNG